MKRFGVLLFLLVALGLASGALADGHRVARRARIDLGHPELEAELPAGVAVLPALAQTHPIAAALPAWAARLRPAAAVRVTQPRAASSSHAERSVVAACSRAPPLLG